MNNHCRTRTPLAATRALAVLSVAALALAPATAQAVSVAFHAQTPLSVQATSGTQASQATLPAGPLPLNGDLVTSPAPGVAAATSWYAMANATGSLFNTVYSNVGGPPASGSAGPHELVVSFTATAPAAALIEFTRDSTVTAGVPWPTVGIDFGNDGTIDVANLGSAISMSLTLGPTPFAVRVLLTSQLPANGLSSTSVGFAATPLNNLTLQQTAFGCAPTNALRYLDIGPSFVGTGVGMVLAPAPELRVFAVGLSPAPFLLPSAMTLPCLVVPKADVLMLVPTGIWFGVHVPLPAAVRPVTVHAQAVGFSTVGLVTSDAWMASAF